MDIVTIIATASGIVTIILGVFTLQAILKRPLSQPTPQGPPLTRRDILQTSLILAGLVTLGTLGVEGYGWLQKRNSQMSGTVLGTVRSALYRLQYDPVRALDWAPGGGKVVCAPGNIDGTVQVWAADQQPSAVLTCQSLPGGALSVAWSPLGGQIVSGSDNHAVEVYDALDGRQEVVFRGHLSDVYAVAWSSDGEHVASASSDNTARVWNITQSSEKPVVFHGHSNGVVAVAWSPTADRVVTGSWDNTAQIWDPATGRLIFVYRGHTDSVLGVAWSPDGSRIATASSDNSAHVWDATTGGTYLTYQGHTSYVTSISWSQDGSRIATGSYDHTVHIWNAQTGERVFVYRGHTDKVNAVVWSLDGQWLASGSDDRTIQIWKAPID